MWVDGFWHVVLTAQTTITITDAAADLQTSNYAPMPYELGKFGGIVTTAVVLGTTNAVWRISTLVKGGTNTGRRDITWSAARAVGDFVYGDVQMDVGASWTTIAVGERHRLRANTAASGGAAAGAAAVAMFHRATEQADSSTMFRQTSTAV